jgi:hypothetical protein
MEEQDKGENQWKHFINRMEERFGIGVSVGKCQGIIKRIQDGRSKFIKKLSNRVSVFLFDIKGDEMHVLYDKKRKSLITAMPRHWKRRCWEDA